jgi:hypothetical protein
MKGCKLKYFVIKEGNERKDSPKLITTAQSGRAVHKLLNEVKRFIKFSPSRTFSMESGNQEKASIRAKKSHLEPFTKAQARQSFQLETGALL